MLPTLTDEEARVIGCLIEKSIVTPDQYPLTLNALKNACNQKSSRNPVMSMTPGDVQRVTRLLAAKNLLRIHENFRSSTEKYAQLFCNTRYNDFKFSDAGLALMCVLMLRGAQTPGELRTNCRRLHDFEDNAAVVQSLDELAAHPKGALVARLPRAPGRRDAEYVQCLTGTPVATAGSNADRNPSGADSREAPPAATAKTAPTPAAPRNDLEARVARLEQDVADLKELLGRS